MIRSLLFALVFYLNSAAFLVLGSPLLLGPRRWAMMGLKAHAIASQWWLKRIVGTRLEVRGRERLPGRPGPRRQQAPVGLGHLRPRPALSRPGHRAEGRAEVDPALRLVLPQVRAHPRQTREGRSRAQGLIRDARRGPRKAARSSSSPRARGGAPGAPPDYKPGFVALYEGLGLPCVPLALNSGVFWPRRSLRRYPGTIVVEFLEPIPPGLPRAAFRAELQRRIEEASSRLAAEAEGVARSAAHTAAVAELIANFNKNIP